MAEDKVVKYIQDQSEKENQAKREYRTKVEEYKGACQPGSKVVGWEMDETNRVY